MEHTKKKFSHSSKQNRADKQNNTFIFTDLSLAKLEDYCDRGLISKDQAQRFAFDILDKKIELQFGSQTAHRSLESINTVPESNASPMAKADDCFEKYRFGKKYVVFSFNAWVLSPDRKQYSRTVYLRDREIPGNALKKIIYTVQFNNDSMVDSDYAICHGEKIGISANMRT